MSDRLIINTNKLVLLIYYDQINFFKSDDCYTNVQLIDSQQYILCKSLKRVELEINSSCFIRVHASYLVNKRSIKSIDKLNRTVCLINDLKIPYTIKLRDLLSSL